MEKKSIFLIVIIVLLVLTIGFFEYGQIFHSEKKITVGNVNFTLPDGFNEGTKNNLGDVNITNGTCTIFIAKYDNNNISDYVKKYENVSSNNNTTVVSSNFTIDDILVYQSINKEYGAEHFWFIKNENVYSIYTWKKYENVDNLIFDLIKSANSTN